MGEFSDSDVISVTYIYNKLLHTMEEDLNSTQNHYENRDYLLREMASITIDTYVQFKEVSGQDFSTVANSVELSIDILLYNGFKTSNP